LQTRKEIRKNRKHRNKSRVDPTLLTPSSDASNEAGPLIPYPENYTKKPFGEQQPDWYPRKEKTKQQKAQNPADLSILSAAPNQGQQQQQPTVVLLGREDATKTPEALCSKRDLIVEFKDIGWANWIIAPLSFEAHYCAGNCPFPLSPDVNPSNHATIQSIIHTIGLHPYVPAVCCAPNKMESLTLLYFDEDDNVVLKNYPQMTVSSCGCL